MKKTTGTKARRRGLVGELRIKRIRRPASRRVGLASLRGVPLRLSSPGVGTLGHCGECHDSDTLKSKPKPSSGSHFVRANAVIQNPFTPGSVESSRCGLGDAQVNVEIQVLRCVKSVTGLDVSPSFVITRHSQWFCICTGVAFLRLPGNQRTCRKYWRCDHTKVWLRKTRAHEPAFSTKNVVSETMRIAPQRILTLAGQLEESGANSGG